MLSIYRLSPRANIDLENERIRNYYSKMIETRSYSAEFYQRADVVAVFLITWQHQPTIARKKKTSLATYSFYPDVGVFVEPWSFRPRRVYSTVATSDRIMLAGTSGIEDRNGQEADSSSRRECFRDKFARNRMRRAPRGNAFGLLACRTS